MLRSDPDGAVIADREVYNQVEMPVHDVFVSFPFEARFDTVFETIQGVAAQRSLQALRIDRSSFAAEPVAEAIRQRVSESRVFIADLTGNNANVLNEIGLAQALGKPLVLITQDAPADAPFNVRGLRILRYDEQDLLGLRRLVTGALAEATSPNEMLRAMLVPSSLGRPPRESWFVIAASPLSFRRATRRRGGYAKLRRTASDYVGVRGLLQAFGLLYGFETLPDNIDPEDCDDAVIREPMNIYCIASPKANRWTREVLEQLQQRWAPRIEFRADPNSRDLQNVRVSIFCDDEVVRPPGWDVSAKGDRYARDFGLIVRAPNPFHPENMVAVMAGRSSLGTEAACRAFTDSNAVSRINQRLAGLDIALEDHRRPFWALVSMRRTLGDEKEEAIPDSLKLIFDSWSACSPRRPLIRLAAVSARMKS